MGTAAELPILLIYAIDPLWTPAERAEVDRESRRLGFAMRRQGHSVRFLPVGDRDLHSALSPYQPGNVLVFNWCEGLPGIGRSDALVAETLEKLQFTYTGASSEALELSYDKPRVKNLLEAHGVPTPRWKVAQSADIHDWDVFPAIVKPAWEHCSVGVDDGAVVSGIAELRHRAAYVLDRLRQPALIEDFIDGREFHVPLWGNQDVEALPAVERDFSGLDDMHKRLCSYEAKFAPESEAYQKIRTYVPARLSGDEMESLESVAIAAYRLLGCRDYGRVDIRLRDGVFYVIDVNPNADISADASIALAAGKAGYCYGAMGSRMLQFAAQRHPQNLAPHQ
ncbi:MAG: D-alanine--D-alanine ligase [Pirellulales bacterium]|nr:D-alanine--D-alanine ligase [Pirellulales bacterium]